LTLILVFALAFAAVASPAWAQYFGRNKVQYQRFNFKIMKTRISTSYFYMEDRNTVKQAGLMPNAGTHGWPGCSTTSSRAAKPLVLYSSGRSSSRRTVIPGR